MHCPFLRKLNVKYCGLYGMKLIPLSADNDTAERCLSRAWLECSLVRDSVEPGAQQDHCPNLCVEDVHYCDLAPVRKLVPCNKAAASRCGGDGHRYCDLYLAMAEPRSRTTAPDPGADPTDIAIEQPDDLAYARNHLWLDEGDGRRVHIGVDAFFTGTLGKVEAVTFPARRAAARPSVLIRVGGMDLEMVLPLALREIEPNAHLAVAPSIVSDDPYGRGWLIAGVPVAEPGADAGPTETSHFLRGTAARRWMRRERDRLTGFVHACLDERRGGEAGLSTDGGHADGDLSALLDRRTLVRLHHEFFALRDGGIPE
jgi:glycine cleavage system H lipoate-binding protein